MWSKYDVLKRRTHLPTRRNPGTKLFFKFVEMKKPDEAAKAFDFSKKPKVKKRVRRQFVVDGQLGFYRGTFDESFPTPWFLGNPIEAQKTSASPVVYSPPDGLQEIETNHSLSKIHTDSTKQLRKHVSFSPVQKSSSQLAGAEGFWSFNDSTMPKSSSSPNVSSLYNKVLKKKNPSYTMAAKHGAAEKANASPGPAYYPATPSKYHRHIRAPQGTVFGTTKRSIVEEPIDQDAWLNRWRPNAQKWKTIDSFSQSSPSLSRKLKPLMLPQIRRFNLGSKDDLNSSLGGTFNSFLRPSTKRTSKIVKNEAYIVEARRNIWKSLRYQERMHLPGVVMKRLKYSKVKLSDNHRKRNLAHKRGRQTSRPT